MLSYIKGGSCEYAFCSYTVDKAQEILFTRNKNVTEWNECMPVLYNNDNYFVYCSEKDALNLSGG